MIEDRRAFKLSHAAHYADQNVMLARTRRAHFADTRVDLPLSLLAHRTGVEQDHVRFVCRVTKFVTGTAQTSGRSFRIGDIHLAAEGLDVNSSLHSSRPLNVATVYQNH